jgi:hypothetical protein
MLHLPPIVLIVFIVVKFLFCRDIPCHSRGRIIKESNRRSTMEAHVTIDVTLDLAGPFAQSGRERRTAVARSLRRLFASPAWTAADEPLERVFCAEEIDHKFVDRESGAAVRVRESSSGETRRMLALVKPEAGREQRRPSAAGLEAMAAEALLYLEAVGLAVADRDTAIRGGRRSLGERRFRETAEWSGRPRRVRGVYRTAVWEALVETFAAHLENGEAETVLEAVRVNHSVWPLSLEFTAEFFPLALKLYTLAMEELSELEEEAVARGEAAGPRRVLPFAPARTAADYPEAAGAPRA